MFGKKCPKCNNRIKKDFDFCPSCGKELKSKYDTEDYGFLGKNDLIEENMFPNFSDSLVDKMFNSAMKLLEKQVRKLHNEMAKNQRSSYGESKNPNDLNIQFFVNGKRIFPEKLENAEPKSFGSDNRYFFEKLKKFPKLPKKEPESKLRRLSGKIVYELYVPGVKSVDDVLINQLENSIEVKALSDNKIYTKSINLNLPIIKYNLKNNFLTIELQSI